MTSPGMCGRIKMGNSKLKILLGNHSLAMLAGTETWTYTLAIALRDLGHEVTCYTPELGIMSRRLEEKGIRCFDDIKLSTGIAQFSPYLTEPVRHEYDVIIANHWHVVAYLREKFPRTPIISTIHGPLHLLEGGAWAPEHPALESGVNQFVVTCGEQADRMLKEYGIEAKVINNFFDIDKFAALKPANSEPKQFLLNSNYLTKDDAQVEVIREAAKHFGARLIAIGLNFVPTPNVLPVIEASDVVFGMGRSVMEGVAAGRLGIVQGRWGTGGPIVASTVDAIRYNNFSGRNSGGRYATTEEVIQMIKEYYNPAVLAWGKEYVALEHNAKTIAEEYVRIAYDLTGASINGAPPDDVPIRPLKRAYEN